MSTSDWITVLVGVLGVAAGVVTTYFVQYRVAMKQMRLEALATLISHSSSVYGHDFLDGVDRIKVLFAGCKGFSESYLKMVGKMGSQDQEEKNKAILDFVEYLYGRCHVKCDRDVLHNYIDIPSRNTK